jgi:hypothetical protein
VQVNIEQVKIDKLIPYARNSRTHSDAQVAQIAASIKEFGFTNPVLIDETGSIIAGHGRVMAARKLAIIDVPSIRLTHLTDAQKKAYIIADNKLALNAGWDDEMLAVELTDLKDMGFDLDLTGFSTEEIEALLAPAGTEGLTDEDAVPEVPEAPVTVLGDVWLLGKHRVMCGDSTSIDAVEKLMGGGMADLCLTDPPYGLGKGKKSGKNDYSLYEDSRENLIQLAKDWLPIAQSVAKVVVFSPGVTNQWLYPEPNWVMCWFYGGGQLQSSWGFNCWQPFLCYGKEPGLAACKGARPDAVDMNTPSNSGDIDHPCPKPVKLWEWFLQRLVFTKDAVLYEPFGGSGTTLIAAEGKRISVNAMELDPKYCDVIVQRWQEFTGQTATLESDGKPFISLKKAA